MSQYDHAQTSFAGGEISPRLKGRVDTDLYKKALDYCLNFEPLAQGSGRMRGGTKFIATLLGAPRLIPFRLRSGQDFVLSLTDRKLQVFAGSGAQQLYVTGGTNANPELVVNGDFMIAGDPAPYSQHYPANWDHYFHGAVYSLPGRVSLYTTDWLRQGINLAAPGNYELHISFSGVSPNVNLSLGSAPGGSDLFSVNTGTPNFSVAAPDLPAGMVYLTIRQDGYVANINSVSLKLRSGVSSLDAPWSNDMLSGVQYAIDSASNTLVLVHPNVAPQVLVLSSTGYIQFGAAVFNTAPGEWAGTNWPSVAEIFQSRLFLGATPQSPNTLWGSRSGAYYDFRTATGANATVLASDAIVAPVATKGILSWMRGRKALLVGTDLGEFAVTSSTGTITPSDLQIQPASGYGAASQQPEELGDQVGYVSRDRRKVRAISYVHDEQNWMSHDLTFVAEHITADVVQELHFARDPNLTMVLPLGSGALACATYDRAEQVNAWWRFTTQGTVISAAVSHGPQGSVLWLAVNRANGIFLESLPMSETDRVYVDAAVTIAEPGEVVSGLAHLEGQQVRVVVDGAVGDNQVVAGGEVSVTVGGEAVSDAESVTVGLPYPDARFRTLPPEGGNPKGSSQRARRRIVRLMLRLNESAMPNVTGQDGKPFRLAPTPVNAAGALETLFTGDVEVAGPLGADNRGMVEISQDLPLRTEVLALFESISVEAL